MSNPAIGRFCAVVSAVMAFAAPAAASAADITVNDDATGAGPAGANCAAPNHSTITAALAAAAASGDRILVCAGTYVQPQVLIDKSVQLIGAGPGQSIIDGGNATGLPSVGLIRTNDSTNGDTLVQGFTLRNAGQVGVSPTANHFSIVPKGNDLGTTQEFADLAIEGRGPGGFDYGFDADNPDPDVILRDSTITGTDFNAVLIERADGAVTLRDNTIVGDGSGSPVFTMNHSSDPTVNPVRIVDNDIDAGGASAVVVQSSFTNLGSPGAFNAVEIRGNDIHNFNTIGIAVTNPTAGDGVLGEIANVDVVDNSLSGSAAATGVRIQGRVRNVNVRGNTLAHMATGVLVNPASAGHSPQRVRIAYNRIAGNSVAGLTSNVPASVDAERNWWGCNEGPGQTGCDSISGTGAGAVDADPWLVLSLTASPSSILTGGDTSRLTASLRTDSDGAAVGSGFPAGTPVGFATNLGSVTTPVGTEDGIATSTLSSDSTAGTADVTASLDGETVGKQVTIVDPPPSSPETTIDSGPANGSTTPDTTPTFGFSSDDAAATFECRYDGDAFVACTGPGNSHTPAAPLSEGIHTFEVRAVDTANVPDPSPAGRTFLVDAPDPTTPETFIDSGPAERGTTEDRTPTFEFSSDDAAATFECRYDGDAFGACSGPGNSHTPSADLTEGIHTFEVRAIDASSVADPTPAARTYLVNVPDSRGPGPRGKVKLAVKVDPRVAKVRAGWKMRYRAVVRNRGTTSAQSVSLCMKVPASLSPDGEKCRDIGTLEAGDQAVKRFQVNTSEATRTDVYKIRFQAEAAATGDGDKLNARLRVRPIPQERR